jgi:hypothetical protein
MQLLPDGGCEQELFDMPGRAPQPGEEFFLPSHIFLQLAQPPRSFLTRAQFRVLTENPVHVLPLLAAIRLQKNSAR